MGKKNIDSRARMRNRPTRTAEFTRPLSPEDVAILDDLHVAAGKAKATVAGLKIRLERLADQGKPTATIDAELLAAEKDAAAAQAAIDKALDSMVFFTFHLRGIGDAAWERLQLAHPPTEEQKVAARAAAKGNPRAEPRVDEDTFGPAAVAATTERISFSDDAPDITDITGADIEEFLANWPGGDREELQQLVLLVNLAGTGINRERLGKG